MLFATAQASNIELKSTWADVRKSIGSGCPEPGKRFGLLDLCVIFVWFVFVCL